MKILFFLCLVLFSTNAMSQTYNRSTNNNAIYSDSTACIEINKLYKLLESGQSFRDMAEKFSQDPGSYKQGGQLQVVPIDRYVEKFRSVLLSLKINEISKPFKTDFGYHIVQLISIENNTYISRHILLRVDTE